MASANLLLGPPGIGDVALPPPSAPATTDGGDASMESIVSQTHNLDISDKPPSHDSDNADCDEAHDDVAMYGGNQRQGLMGLTENLSPTFLSTGNPCLDLFFHVVPHMNSDDVIGRLESAWSHDPLTTLKLICNLRGVRGTGKSDKENFYTAALWLHKNHPKTLAGNARALAGFGYFKDLLEILYRILEGPEVRKIAKEERLMKSRGVYLRKPRREIRGRFRRRKGVPKKEDGEKKEKKVKTAEEIREERERARVLRKQNEAAKARKALEMYNHDINYQFLHDQISNLFAELLKSDIENLNSNKPTQISLASKWCPTIDSSYDKSTLICESIARKVFPRSLYPEYEGLEEVHYAYRVRDRLRKQVLVPLHKALELPEVYMSAQKWNSLPYNRVPSVAMKNYKEFFMKHDADRFKEYLENVKKGKATIAAGALLPHEIIKALSDGDGGDVAELQWKRMVEDLAKKGKLANCIAICDVSGSMMGIPMELSVALGVLVSELSEEPWKGRLITFSANPELQKVEGDTLLAKTEFVRAMEWGANTNFQKVFDRILEVAVEGNLSEDQMIKRVFVFSDMEFDQATRDYEAIQRKFEESGYQYMMTAEFEQDSSENNTWETDYEAIKRKFEEKGYRNVPEIVFWNLRSSNSTPVMGNQKGVALVSGFSKNILTMFLEGGGIVNPVEVMEKAISGEEYDQLAVLD